MDYKNSQELTSKLYQTFLDKMQERSIYALSGSGTDVIPFIADSVTATILNNEIPGEFNLASGSPDIAKKVQLVVDNVIKLANQMADDAIAANSTELHEWSLDKAKRRLCPLWPFLKEPCNKN